MKKLFSFSKRRKASPSASETNSVLSVGYDLKEKGLSKVHKAAFTGDVAKLKQLAKKKDLNQLDEENRTALHIACVYGHTEVVQYLVENKAKLNICDNQNCSALMKAVQCQQDHCVSILLEHEADPNLVDINGNTALHLVACIPSLPMAMKLLEHKVNINAQNKEGNTPLILSVKENHAEMAECLLKEGADINVQNKEQQTPLLIASCNGQLSMVQLLLQYSADITVKDNKGWSSDDYALMNGHLACSHLINEHETKRKPLQSLSHLGFNKSKQTSLLGSPEAGFALGPPALLNDVTEDNSNAETVSRASESGPVDSWPSTDNAAADEDHNLGLKKPQKLNLKKLMSAFQIKGKMFAVDENPDKSLNYIKSEPISEGNAVEQKGFLGSSTSTQHTVTPKGKGWFSFSNLLQLTSLTSLQKDGEKSSLEDEYEEDHPDEDVENKTSDIEHIKMNESSKDRDIYSGLGLEKEHEEEDSPWNSELSDKVFSQSDSDSPSKKEQRRLNSLINSHKPISSIYEENNDDWDLTTNREASKNFPVYKPKEAVMKETPAPLPLVQKQDLGTSVPQTQGAAKSKKEKGNESSLKGTRPVPMSDEDSDWNTDSISSSAKMTPPLPDIIETETVAQDRERDCSSEPNHPEEGVLAKAGVMTGEPESSVLWSTGGSGKQTDVDQVRGKKPDTISDRPNRKQEGMCDNGLIPLKNGTIMKWDHIPLKWPSRSPRRSATQIDHEKKRVVGSEGNLLYAHAPDQSRDACPVTHSNGGALSVFDDSTLSEVSEDERRFPSTQYSGLSTEEKNGGELEMTDDFEDLTQSSGKTTEDLDSATSCNFKTSLLIKQLETSSIDSVNMVKLQNICHEYEQTIQKERDRRTRLAEKVSQLKQEQNELKCLVNESQDSKSTLENLQLELETDHSYLKFLLKQEQEKHQRTSLLYDKTREQLSRKEKQHQYEVEEREKVELKMRNLELEIRALMNSLKQLEVDRNETQRLLAHEKNIRALQEDLLKSHLRKQLDIEERNLWDFTKRNELTEAREHVRELKQQVCILQDELGSVRAELEHFHSQHQQEESRLADERDELQERLEDAQRDLKLNDETLAQTIFQYNGQMSTLKAECVQLSNKLEHEKQVHQQLVAEAESTKARLLAALQETERCQAVHAETERTLQHEREQHQRSEEKWTSESNTQRDTIQSLSQKLIQTEACANNQEIELHRATLSVAEKSALLETVVHEREQARTRLEELERALQNERDRSSFATARHDALQERLIQIQCEGVLLKQQLDEVQNRGTAKDVTDVQDCFTQALSQLHASGEERVQLVEEKSKELAAKNAELREQNYRLEQEKADREMSLWQLQQELANTLKKLSMCEASLEVNNRYRSDLEEEKVLAQKDMKRLKGKLQESEEQNMQVERRIKTLMGNLDEKERDLNNSGQKLQEVLAASRHTEQIIKQLQETAQRLEIENAGLEETVKQQNNRIEILQKGAEEATAVRNHLENLLTNLQSSKMTLEEQLSHEEQKQSMLSSNVHDSQVLWEEEMKNQSRLGHRLAKLEKEKEELIKQMKQEKKKAIKITEQKKTVDAQLDQEMNRNNKLQKEMCRLRTLVKSAKKQLRGQNVGEQTEESFSRMKIKVDELQVQLDREASLCSQLEDMNRELKEQLSSLKNLEHSHESLEHSKQQLEEEVKALRKRLQAGVMDQSEAMHFRIETEMRARQEIQQKLDEVNVFLQTKAANDKSQRAELEQRIRELEAELSRAHTSQPASLLQRDSTRTELEHYRQLYNDELRHRKSLAAKLKRSNEQLAKANAKLLSEESSMSLLSNAVINRNLSSQDLNTRPSLDGQGLKVSPLIPVRDHHQSSVETFLANIHSNLEKNISTELNYGTNELKDTSTRMSPVGSPSSQKNLNSALNVVQQDPLKIATQEYLKVLRRNYMI